MQHDSDRSALVTRTHLQLCGLVVLMFGFAFALVPLYDTLCSALGINGKVEQAEYAATAESTGVPLARDVQVELISSNSDSIGWSFYPLTDKLTVQPGEMQTVQFYARNNTRRDMTVQAIPSISPGEGAGYLKKVECFCFQAQTLAAGESIEMPVVFYVEPALPEKYSTLTLAYALYEIEPL